MAEAKLACKGCDRTTHITLPQFGVIVDTDGYCAECRPHGLFLASTLMNPSAVQWRHEPFCRCGWRGTLCGEEGTARSLHDHHVVQARAKAAAAGVAA